MNGMEMEWGWFYGVMTNGWLDGQEDLDMSELEGKEGNKSLICQFLCTRILPDNGYGVYFVKLSFANGNRLVYSCMSS